ncbi:MAG TPA: FAD:protein FMN transferase [Blastocatellia bacterium]|nr:FAD:protein FMN transferase [Blastocatellia bacterium]
MLKRREFIKFSAGRQSTAGDYWLHISRPAMACRFEVTLPMRERAGVSAASDALDEIDRIEQQLTVFKETSEVSFINRNAASGEIRVEPSLMSLLLLCKQLWRETEGAFDITSGPLSRCWGFLNRQGRIPEPFEIERARSLVGSDNLSLDAERGTIRFKRAGVEINLGSIGKGYALDRIAALMRRRVRSALLSAGSSSIHALGRGEPGGWVIGLRHPRDKRRRMAILRLRNLAMSTSGSDEQFFEHDGRRFGHIIDPRSGMPADRVSGVTVVARSAALADALATAFYVGGPLLAERYCSAHPGVLAIMLESESDSPVLFGSNDECDVEIIDE